MTTEQAPEVSVVTVAYQHRDGLRSTLESIDAQSGVRLESIVIDGGSSDGSVELLAARTSPHRTVHVSEPDAGIYDAMNKGSALATGDLVVFMNAGDRFSSTETCAWIASDHARRGWRWAYGCARVLRPDRTGEAVLAFVPFRRDRLALGLATVPHQAMAMERTLLTELGGYRTDVGVAADQRLVLQAALAAEPVVWAEFVCDFEGGGVGSGRGVLDHVRDMRRYRRDLEVRVGGSRWADAAAGGLTYGYVATMRAQQALRRRRG